MLGGSVAVYSIGRMTRHSHLAVVGADLTRGLFVSQAWVQGLKYAVQRERPDKSNNVSFPSGHAAGGFAVAAVLARHYGWKAAIPAYAGAAYIATARVHDDKHYLSDVVFGAAMGIAGSRTVLRTGQYRVQLVPAIAPGRIGLTATVVPPRQRTTTAFPQ
jgi:membrane-associated phospholipid phosphatase